MLKHLKYLIMGAAERLGFRVRRPILRLRRDVNAERVTNRPVTTRRVLSRTRVLFVAPIYNYYPTLVSSLREQTHAEWKLLLMHDGPNTTGLRDIVEGFDDERIDYVETGERADDWGHSLRAAALEQIADGEKGDFVVITNADNYYVPGFVGLMLNAFEDDTVAVYCDAVHSHIDWRLLDTRLENDHIDCGCVMVRREAALAVGWRGRSFAADWDYVSDLLERYTVDRFRKLPRPLMIHN